MFTLEIRTAGSSFDDGNAHLAELLENIAEHVKDCVGGNKTHSIIDSNGNRCGSWKLVK